MSKLITGSDWTSAATTLVWYLSDDLLPDQRGRAWFKAGVMVVGGGATAWFERDSLREAKQELATSHDIAQRLDAGELAPDDPEVAEFLAPDDDAGPTRSVLVGVAAASAVLLGSEVALRRLGARRVARGARLPHLPGALVRTGLALALGPLLRKLEKPDRRTP